MGDGLGSLILGFIGLLIFGAAWMRVATAADDRATIRAVRQAATVTVMLAALLWLGSLFGYGSRHGAAPASAAADTPQ